MAAKVRPRFSQTEDGFHECLLISFRCGCLGEQCLFEYFIWKVGYIVSCDACTDDEPVKFDQQPKHLGRDR